MTVMMEERIAITVKRKENGGRGQREMEIEDEGMEVTRRIWAGPIGKNGGREGTRNMERKHNY